jgi:hypothetical protein
MTLIPLPRPATIEVRDHTGTVIGTARNRDEAERLQKRQMAHHAAHLLQVFDGCSLEGEDCVPVFRIPGFAQLMRPVNAPNQQHSERK